MRCNVFGCLILLLCTFLCACAQNTHQGNIPNPTDNTQPSTGNAPASNGADSQTPIAAPGLQQVDFSTLNQSSISAYNHGSLQFELSDITPMLSPGSGYHEKWEFFAYTKPYEIRIKFEISSMAFTKNEGKVAGYIKKYDGDTLVNTHNINEKFGAGVWSADSQSLNLVFGDFSLQYKNDRYYLHGTYEGASFDLEIEPHIWKPGTGVVYFGNSTEKYFKYAILSYYKPIIRGQVSENGQTTALTGYAYANHYATNLPIYDMFTELQDYRKITPELVVEYRYYVPTAQYDPKPFGFAFIAYDGVPLFASTQLQRTILETWIDDEHYGYTVPMRQMLQATDDAGTFSMQNLNATVNPSDPYKDLSTFQRNIASRVAKPMSYSVASDFEINLVRDSMRARIPLNGTFAITLFE